MLVLHVLTIHNSLVCAGHTSLLYAHLQGCHLIYDELRFRSVGCRCHHLYCLVLCLGQEEL